LRSINSTLRNRSFLGVEGERVSRGGEERRGEEGSKAM